MKNFYDVITLLFLYLSSGFKAIPHKCQHEMARIWESVENAGGFWPQFRHQQEPISRDH